MAAEELNITDDCLPAIFTCDIADIPSMSISKKSNFFYSSAINSTAFQQKICSFIEAFKSTAHSTTEIYPELLIALPEGNLALFLSEGDHQKIKALIDSLSSSDTKALKKALTDVLNKRISTDSFEKDNALPIISRRDIDNINESLEAVWLERTKNTIVGQFNHPSTLQDSVIPPGFTALKTLVQDSSYVDFIKDITNAISNARVKDITKYYSLLGIDVDTSTTENTVEMQSLAHISDFLTKTALKDLQQLIAISSEDHSSSLSIVSQQYIDSLFILLDGSHIKAMPAEAFDRKIISPLIKGEPPFNAAIEFIQCYGTDEQKTQLLNKIQSHVEDKLKDIDKLSVIDSIFHLRHYADLKTRLIPEHQRLKNDQAVDGLLYDLEQSLRQPTAKSDVSINPLLKKIAVTGDPSRLTQLCEILIHRPGMQQASSANKVFSHLSTTIPKILHQLDDEIRETQKNLNQLTQALNKDIDDYKNTGKKKSLIETIFKPRRDEINQLEAKLTQKNINKSVLNEVFSKVEKHHDSDISRKDLTEFFLYLANTQASTFNKHHDTPLANIFAQLMQSCAVDDEKIQVIYNLIDHNWQKHFSDFYVIDEENQKSEDMPKIIFADAFMKESFFLKSREFDITSVKSSKNIVAFLKFRNQLYQALLKIHAPDAISHHKAFLNAVKSVIQQNKLYVKQETGEYQFDKSIFSELLTAMKNYEGIHKLLQTYDFDPISGQNTGYLHSLYNLMDDLTPEQLQQNQSIRDEFSQATDNYDPAHTLAMIYLESVFLPSRVSYSYEQAYIPLDKDLSTMKASLEKPDSPEQKQDYIDRYKSHLNHHKKLVSKAIKDIIDSKDCNMIYRVETLLNNFVSAYLKAVNQALTQWWSQLDPEEQQQQLKIKREQLKAIDDLAIEKPYEAIERLHSFEDSLNAEELALINDEKFPYGYELKTLAITMNNYINTPEVLGTNEDYIQYKQEHPEPPKRFITDTSTEHRQSTQVTGKLYP